MNIPFNMPLKLFCSILNIGYAPLNAMYIQCVYLFKNNNSDHNYKYIICVKKNVDLFTGVFTVN